LFKYTVNKCAIHTSNLVFLFWFCYGYDFQLHAIVYVFRKLYFINFLSNLSLSSHICRISPYRCDHVPHICINVCLYRNFLIDRIKGIVLNGSVIDRIHQGKQEQLFPAETKWSNWTFMIMFCKTTCTKCHIIIFILILSRYKLNLNIVIISTCHTMQVIKDIGLNNNT